jgi:predicted RNase H-like nuclease (RuvC/YqgF family)
MSLDDANKTEEENEINYLKTKLDNTTNLVQNLNKQLDELKDMVII